jgi:hypothetical protein
VIESRTTRSFRTAFAALPDEVQAQARRAYRLFLANPAHPSLRFKKVEQTENVYPFGSDSATALWVFSRVPSSPGFGSALTLTTIAGFDVAAALRRCYVRGQNQSAG